MKKRVYRERRKKDAFSDLLYKKTAKMVMNKLAKETEILSVITNDDLEKTIETKMPTIDDEGNFDPGGIILRVKSKKDNKKKSDKNGNNDININS